MYDLKKIVLACPVEEVPYNHLSKKIKASNKNNFIGNHESLFIGSSTKNIIRKNLAKVSLNFINRLIN